MDNDIGIDFMENERIKISAEIMYVVDKWPSRKIGGLRVWPEHRFSTWEPSIPKWIQIQLKIKSASENSIADSILAVGMPTIDELDTLIAELEGLKPLIKLIGQEKSAFESSLISDTECDGCKKKVLECSVWSEEGLHFCSDKCFIDTLGKGTKVE